MNILVIGSGGREHALVKKFQAARSIAKIHAIPGNILWKNIISNPKISIMNFGNISMYCQKHKIDFVIVGPEEPLTEGITDFLNAKKIKVFGPSLYCAQLEKNKAFAKTIMQKLRIPTAKYQIAKSRSEAEKIIDAWPTAEVVLKSVNLAAGKGVCVASDHTQAKLFIKQIFEDNIFGPNNSLVIEEFLTGFEFSLMVLTDGKNIYPLPTSHDYKRIHNGNQGENTGGMGAFSPVSNLKSQEIKKTIRTCIRPLIRYLEKQKHPYCGVLYAGLMKLPNGDIKVLEYNVRFGDPETEVILPLIKNDMGKIFWQLLNHQPIQLRIFPRRIWMGIVVTASGYPSPHYAKNIDVSFIAQKKNVIFMGVKTEKKQIISAGGRIFLVRTFGTSLMKVHDRCYKLLQTILPKGDQPLLHYRKDIGTLIKINHSN